MKILDTAKRRQKEQAKKDLRKAIKYTLDNVGVDEAWKDLDESLQNAMNVLGLAPGDDPCNDKDIEFAEMIMLVAAAFIAKGASTAVSKADFGSDPLTPEDFIAIKKQIGSWGSVPCQVSIKKQNGSRGYVSCQVSIEELTKGNLKDFSMGCSVKPQSCPLCGDPFKI